MSASFFSQIKPLRKGGWWRSFGYGAWALGSVAGVGGLVIGLALGAWELVVGPTEGIFRSTAGLFALYAAQYLVGLSALLILPVFFLRQRWPQIKKFFGILRGVAWNDVGLALVSIMPYFAVSISLQMIIIALVPGFDSEQAQDIGFENLTSPAELLMAFAALVVIAPLAEELIFRGYLYSHVRHNLSFWAASIFVSVLFGLMHGQWNVGIDTFVLSLVLCYLRERTGSIWAGVLLHALKNGIAFTLLFVISPEELIVWFWQVIG